MSLFSLAAILLGIIGAFKLMGAGVVWLANQWSVDPTILPYISFLIIFLLIVILVKFTGSLLKASISETILGEADQILGGILGVIRYAFLMSVLIWIFSSMDMKLPESWKKDSLLLPKLEKTAPFISERVGSLIPSVKDLFQENSSKKGF